MAILTFNGIQYEVDHAVKGSDYINGYDANGAPVVCITGIVDFSAVTYTSEYMSPESCAYEPCNDVVVANGSLETRAGNTSVKAALGTDYGVARVRNIYAGTEDMTAGVSALNSGDIYLVYE